MQFSLVLILAGAIAGPDLFTAPDYAAESYILDYDMSRDDCRAEAIHFRGHGLNVFCDVQSN
jgi:hypothetical protein